MGGLRHGPHEPRNARLVRGQQVSAGRQGAVQPGGRVYGSLLGWGPGGGGGFAQARSRYQPRKRRRIDGAPPGKIGYPTLLK